MRFLIVILLIGFIFTSCTTSELKKEFSCNSDTFSGVLEKNTDIKKTFTIQVPKHWKTNLYYTELQSSVYFADTTKQLTESVLIDITQIKREYKFDATFENIISKNDSIQQLSNIKKKKFSFLEKDAYYSISKGFKRNFPYQIVNIFVKKNPISSYHIKTEIYGELEVEERTCKALNLISTLELH